jgi:hypothetical protein
LNKIQILFETSKLAKLTAYKTLNFSIGRGPIICPIKKLDKVATFIIVTTIWRSVY